MKFYSNYVSLQLYERFLKSYDQANRDNYPDN